MSTSEPRSTITGLFIGPLRPLQARSELSGIHKQASSGPLWLTKTGFVGDQQADLKNHGGLDKAVHHYPGDHYASWKRELGAGAADFGPGRFGENLSTASITEADLCIGDVLSIGAAVVQVSQGRQPCWKLNAHTGNSQMASLFQKTARTGWYYRVLQEGYIKLGDRLSLVERPNAFWTVAQVTRSRFDPALDPRIALEISKLPELAEGWGQAFSRKAHIGYVENPSARLFGTVDNGRAQKD